MERPNICPQALREAELAAAYADNPGTITPESAECNPLLCAGPVFVPAEVFGWKVPATFRIGRRVCGLVADGLPAGERPQSE